MLEAFKHIVQYIFMCVTDVVAPEPGDAAAVDCQPEIFNADNLLFAPVARQGNIVKPATIVKTNRVASAAGPVGVVCRTMNTTLSVFVSQQYQKCVALSQYCCNIHTTRVVLQSYQ